MPVVGSHRPKSFAVERRQVRPGAALVLVFDPHRPTRARRRGRMSAEARLNTGLFIDAQDTLVGGEGRPSHCRIEGENALRLQAG